MHGGCFGSAFISPTARNCTSRNCKKNKKLHGGCSSCFGLFRAVSSECFHLAHSPELHKKKQKKIGARRLFRATKQNTASHSPQKNDVVFVSFSEFQHRNLFLSASQVFAIVKKIEMQVVLRGLGQRPEGGFGGSTGNIILEIALNPPLTGKESAEGRKLFKIKWSILETWGVRTGNRKV